MAHIPYVTLRAPVHIAWNAGHYMLKDEILDMRPGEVIWIYPTPLWFWAVYP